MSFVPADYESYERSHAKPRPEEAEVPEQATAGDFEAEQNATPCDEP